MSQYQCLLWLAKYFVLTPFEQDLQQSLRCLLGSDLRLPPTSDVLDVLEKDATNIPGEFEGVPLPNTPSASNIPAGLEIVSLPDKPSPPRKEQYIEDLQRGTKIMKAYVRSLLPREISLISLASSRVLIPTILSLLRFLVRQKSAQV